MGGFYSMCWNDTMEIFRSRRSLGWMIVVIWIVAFALPLHFFSFFSCYYFSFCRKTGVMGIFSEGVSFLVLFFLLSKFLSLLRYVKFLEIVPSEISNTGQQGRLCFLFV